VEKKCQKVWAETNFFVADAPSNVEAPPYTLSPAELRAQKPKLFGLMAYPYMNSTLHAGHDSTLSKIEFTAGYERMCGKRMLFPMGFHCTGMAIKACADKLKREVGGVWPSRKRVNMGQNRLKASISSRLCWHRESRAKKSTLSLTPITDRGLPCRWQARSHEAWSAS
jgi:leucyl-tRNA synthetase